MLERNTQLNKIAEETDKNSLYLPVSVLPSQFKPYPKGTSVSYRRYGWLEIKYLAQVSAAINENDKYTLSMNGIIVEGMDKNKLTTPDYLYLQLLRKISTINPSFFEVAYECSKCKKVSTFNLRIDQLAFEDLSIPNLPAKVKLSSGELSFSPLTCGDNLKFSSLNIPDVYEFASLMALSCTSHPYEEAYQIITERCNPKDIAILEEVDRLFDHGLRPVENTCQNNLGENGETCGLTSKIRLDGGEGFALPFRFERSDVLNAITFGNSSTPTTSLT